MFFYNIYRTNVFNSNHSKIRIKTTRSNLLNESRKIKFTIIVKQRNSSPCEKDNLKKRKLIVRRASTEWNSRNFVVSAAASKFLNRLPHANATREIGLVWFRGKIYTHTREPTKRSFDYQRGLTVISSNHGSSRRVEIGNRWNWIAAEATALINT